MLIVVNNRQELKIVDPFAFKELDIVDISHIPLQYRSINEKRCFHTSVEIDKGRLYCLSIKGVFGGHLLGWKERLDSFIKEGRWVDALSICYEFYQGKTKNVLGLASAVDAKQQAFEEMKRILKLYASVSLQSKKADNSFFHTVAVVCIDYCLSLDALDILFSDIYPIFVRTKLKRLFLEQLEPFVVGDQLSFLPPNILKEIVEVYASEKDFRKLESVILHIDVTKTDLHHLVKLAEKYYLCTALFYIYVRGTK